MDEINVVLDDGAFMPERAHDADAGYDIRTPVDFIVCNGGSHGAGSATVDTGVHIEIPKGYVGILKSKSGLNVKHNILGTGTIDSGYTGSIRVKLYNHSLETKVFKRGDKIIQLVLFPIFTPRLKQVESLKATERGNDGFGSTGE